MKRAALLLSTAAAILVLLASVLDRPPSVPSLAAVRAAHRPSDIAVLDRKGRLLHEVRVDPTVRRTAWIPLVEVSPALQSAVVASEDRRFYRHRGVDARALLAAGAQWLRGGPPRGASTLTMQLAALLDARLARTAGPRSVAQKWRQMRLAWAIERSWSKAEILEAYLNRVSFRGELQGVGAAAGALFGKTPEGLAPAEGAVLAALIRSPSAARAAVVRRALAVPTSQRPAADEQEVAAAAAMALERPAGLRASTSAAPHLARRLVGSPGGARTGPLRTTLDRDLQEFAAEALRRHLLAARGRHVRDGAVLVVENRSGDVLAYVGGTGSASGAPHVDGVRGRRQAGSALKPFLYALALERRLLTAASLLDDTPLDVPVARGLFRPRNYDERFRGPISVRTALAGSVNVPAVRALQLVGADAFVEQLRRLGFGGVTEAGDYYGPSLALGSADVTLWELVAAYRALAQGGEWTPMRVERDEAALGARRRVVSRPTAFIVSSILADRESRSTTFGLENPLALPFWSAVKTGTSKDMRDNWCIGYSPRYTVGVWVGNLSGEPMHDVSGVTGAAPVWAEVMVRAHGGVRVGAPENPPGVRLVPVRFARGVEVGRSEWFLPGTEPVEAETRIAAAARIVTPASGSIVALDPDIPGDQQRLALEAVTGRQPLRWLLDGADLGPAARLILWPPVPGRHTLTLVDHAQRTVDEVQFQVRGQSPAPRRASP